MSFCRFLASLIFISHILTSITVAQSTDNTTSPPPGLEQLSEMSIKDLINIQVTSVAKKPQNLFKSPAAIFALTAEDIRRSGATSLPELLRLVPGMDVDQISSNLWAVSSRGFNDLFANKLLVLIDGRSVYTPLYSGVFWDSQDTVLEDIDRIEVIRGPGATLWGANAVNGVINVITKNAGHTQGALVSGGGGTEERGFGSVRYGGEAGDNAHYRVFAKYFNRDNFTGTDDNSAYDAWQSARGGFRYDAAPSSTDAITIQGDGYYGDVELGYSEPSFTSPFAIERDVHRPINGANLLGRYSHNFSDTSDITVQTYYDRVQRDDKVLTQTQDTYDIDVQHRFVPHPRHEIIWGANYRLYHDNLDNSEMISFSPANRDVNLVTWFAQDEITLLPETLKIIFGSKFEENQYTHFEYQPNIRTVFTPNDDNTMWGAISRAVRTPSRVHVDGRLNRAVIPNSDNSETLISVFGRDDDLSEDLIAYEVGYRRQITQNFSLDIVTFFNNYTNIQTLEPGMPFSESDSSSAHIVQPIFFDNRGRAQTYGAELAADWEPLEWWRLVASYSYLNLEFDSQPDSGDINAAVEEGESPDNQFSIRSQLSITDNWEFDSTFRYVDRLPSIEGTPPVEVDSYCELDLRLGWHPTKQLEISLVGQNLLNPDHLEHVARNFINTEPVEVQRGVYGKVTWRF